MRKREQHHPRTGVPAMPTPATLVEPARPIPTTQEAVQATAHLLETTQRLAAHLLTQRQCKQQRND
jgi:hypothetical protein